MGKIFINPGTDMATIQKALDCRNSEVVFTPGNHKITRTLYIDSDIKLTMGQGAKLQQAARIHNLLMTRVYKSTTGYNGARKIVIDGLTIEAMGKYATKLNLLTLWHAQDVIIRNSTFLDAYHFHALEINGCKNILVDDSKFLGYNSNKKADFREQIQIDFSSESAIFLFGHGSKCYDNTCCEDIVIRNCMFDKSMSRPGASSCIGNHAQSSGGLHHKRITIENCEFVGYGTNPKDACIKLVSMDDVIIRNNKAEGFGRFVLASAKDYSYANNGTKCKARSKDGTCSNITYDNNEEINPTGGYKAYKFYHARGES